MSPSPASPEPTAAPAQLEVACDQNLVLTVSSPTVAATASGVAVLVTSEAPAGAYLNYGYGGDEMPASPAEWSLAPPPGEWELSCSTLEVEGAAVVVTVVDPGGYWSPATLEELGCPVGGVPSWAVGEGVGPTAQEAVEDLMANFNAIGVPELTHAELAEIGYPEAASQTWIVGTEQVTRLTAVAFESGAGFAAYPDVLCAETAWPSLSQPVD